MKIKNAFIIVDNINIENNIRFAFGALKEYYVKIKLLNGVIYAYDDNYYFLTRGSFNKYKNKKSMIEKVKKVISELKPSCIVDLSIIYSNYLNTEHIFQISSAVIHNNKKLNDLISSNTSNTSQANNVNKILTGPESIYITFLLSNYFSIPCTVLCVTYSERNDLSDLSDLSNSNKQLKKVSDKIVNTMFSIF